MCDNAIPCAVGHRTEGVGKNFPVSSRVQSSEASSVSTELSVRELLEGLEKVSERSIEVLCIENHAITFAAGH